MYTGNEKVYPFRDLAKPAPRGHKVPKPGDTGGAKIVLDALAERIAETDVDVRYETGATNLVVSTDPSGDGGVGRCGLAALRRARHDPGQGGRDRGGRLRRQRRRWWRRTPPSSARSCSRWPPPTTTASASGSAPRPAASCGCMDQAFITAPFYPPAQLVTGIVVNKLGERFVAEDSYHSRTSGFVMDQPDQAAYLIVDSAHIEHPDFPLCPFIDGWETVAEMEAALGIPDGRAGEDAVVVQRARGAQGGPRLPQAPRLARAAGRRPVGCLRPDAGQGDVRRLHDGRPARLVDGEVQREDGCGRPGPVRRAAPARSTSPRTARATPPAPSSPRAPTSVGGPGRHAARAASV